LSAIDLAPRLGRDAAFEYIDERGWIERIKWDWHVERASARETPSEIILGFPRSLDRESLFFGDTSCDLSRASLRNIREWERSSSSFFAMINSFVSHRDRPKRQRPDGIAKCIEQRERNPGKIQGMSHAWRVERTSTVRRRLAMSSVIIPDFQVRKAYVNPTRGSVFS